MIVGLFSKFGKSYFVLVSFSLKAMMHDVSTCAFHADKKYIMWMLYHPVLSLQYLELVR